jgi:hypothetical protein
VTLELKPLCTATYELGEMSTISDGPTGTRLISEIVGARFEGERFNASLHGRAAADWAAIEPDGRIKVDVRLTLKTDDEAIVYVAYQGRGHISSAFAYSAPLFETGDERYEWLTRVQAVGKSEFDGTGLSYEIYELV